MFMNTKLKSFFYTAAFVAISISFALTGCNSNTGKPTVAPVELQAFAELTVEDVQNASNPAQWQMVWIDNFGISEITDQRLEDQLEIFIKGVRIITYEINGRLITIKARTAGCWSIAYEARRIIVIPARTEEKVQQDGSIEYDHTPATYKPSLDVVAVGGACTYHPEIDGKVYDLNWYEPMNAFISLNFQKAENRIDGNMLEWVGPNGKTLARFEKIPTQKK